MTCFVPFNNRNLDLSLFVLRPTVVLLDELFETLKHISRCTKSLGCVQSSIFQSIHGNMIIWYGAWMKKSSENKEVLTDTLVSMLSSTSCMATLIDHSFFDAYTGESRDGHPTAARFTTGDIISMDVMVTRSDNINDLSYANLALFRSRFLQMDGARYGVCLRCQSYARVASIYIWESLQCCYSRILNSDLRGAMSPYLERFSLENKYDVFRVVYVSGDEVATNFQVN